MNWQAVYPILPEITLLVLACVVALTDLWWPGKDRIVTYCLAQGSLVIVALLQLWYFWGGATYYAMQRMVVADPMGHLLGLFATIAMMTALVYARPYAASREMLRGELFTLSMFSLLGILVMVAANNFLVVYLGLELMSLSLYALVAMRRDDTGATEAAMKYFVLGALASGFLLYGLSMMYGATGSLEMNEVFKAIGTGRINRAVLVFGTVFVVAGLAFKLGAVPFHMWVPDVYQGAPTSMTLLVGGAPKLAAFAITIRLLVEGMIGLALDWQQMLVLLSLASMLLGNLAAIAQSNIKRMLAYSTIAHMGFMLMGFLAADLNGYSAAMFYTVTYVLTSLVSFGMILLLSRKGYEADNLDDLKGLNTRSPWWAFIMLLAMFSLAGMPPTIGFYAKLLVLQAAVKAGFVWLAVVGVVAALIGAFYYLRIVKLMYFDEPVDRSPIDARGDTRVMLSANGLALLLFGILPQPIMGLCAVALVQSQYY